ncbi:MAG TPA: ABC transporter ATP-binding protein [Steroidobacteraceae bacterium]
MIIQSEGLNKSFRRHAALRGISLAVPEGSIYALIGVNGAGKTTTIKMLLNILTPTSGRADVLGVDSRRLSPQEFAQIGYVSENQELPPRLTLRTYLGYLRPFYPTWDDSLERELIADFQLPIDAKIRDLSHGTRMKASLACALCYRPKLLVLDEPFSGLDPLVRDELMERLLQQAQEMTVFLSSHELDEIEASTTHVGFLEHGRLLFQESKADLAARVREIRITFLDAAQLPSTAPATWLNLAVSGSVLSFVDVGYSPEALQASVSSAFTGIREIEVQPVALRSIFTALARSSQSREAST